MNPVKNSTRTMEEEMSKVQKYWKKNALWTALLLAGVFLWSFLTGPGLSVAPGALALTLTAHDGSVTKVDYSTVTEVQWLEEPEYGTAVAGTDQKNGKSGTWEHPQWGIYTLCVYDSCTGAVKIQTDAGCYVVNLASAEETAQLYQLIQDKMPESR